MRANRRKYEFRVTGHGTAATVTARTRGAAVHQWRRICQPADTIDCSIHRPGATSATQLQPRTTSDDGWFDDVQVELLTQEPKPERIGPEVPPVFVPSISNSGKAEQPLAAGLHPDTAKPTPRWEWVFHSCGADGGRKPIDYGRLKGAA